MYIIERCSPNIACLKDINLLGGFFAIFYKWDNVSHFLFTALHMKPFLQMSLL